jgi:hypothetical protein
MADYSEYALPREDPFVVGYPEPPAVASGISKVWYVCAALAVAVLVMAYMVWTKPGARRAGGTSVSDPYLTTWKELVRKGG